jgi:hypothetical protein
MMVGQGENGRQTPPVVTPEDVERVLAVGRLLLSVLTPEELDQLQKTLTSEMSFSNDGGRHKREIGNAGVS